MAKKIHFTNNIVDNFSYILSTRNYARLGEINPSCISDSTISVNMLDANEISFSVSKYYYDFNGNKIICNNWNEITDLKLVYVVQLDEYYQIEVSLNESDETVKTVTGTSLCQAELSQTILYNIEINTTDDINNELYDANYPTLLYRNLSGYTPGTKEYDKLKHASLLHRILEKVPHYSIKHVDSSIVNLQRSFSIDNTSIYDFLTGDCSQQFNCLFVFDSCKREIYVYDLYTNCNSEINVKLIESEENLEDEYVKISEYGLDQYSDRIKNGTMPTVYGNIDMNNRVVINWTESLIAQNKEILDSWGYEPEPGGVDTVFGGSSYCDILDREVAFTPIVINNGVPKFVNRNTLIDYIYYLADLSNGDYDAIFYYDRQGMEFNGQFLHGMIACIDGYNSEFLAIDVGSIMHFVGYYGAINLANLQIEDAKQNPVYGVCGYRGNFNDVCPVCGGSNLSYYGEDTLIYVDKDNLTDSINYTTDVGSIKNVLKLEAGDDLMTSTVRSLNVNGSDYIYYVSEEQKNDMSDELVSKLNSYNHDYDYYSNQKHYELDYSLVSSYNEICNKYSNYSDCPSTIEQSITGYSGLNIAMYNCLDMESFLSSSLMPNVSIPDTNSSEEIKKLTNESISPVSTKTIPITKYSAESAVLNYTKTLIYSSRFKVEVFDDTYSYTDTIGNWSGYIKITNYSDETDTSTTQLLNIQINTDYENYIEQKIKKSVLLDVDEESIYNIFSIKDIDLFKKTLESYSLNRLKSFYDSYNSILDILQEEQQAYVTADLYNDYYSKYYEKLLLIEKEIKTRELQLFVLSQYNENNELNGGLYYELNSIKSYVNNTMNFEKYLGENLYKEFCSYRREDKYTNSNYISDGLTNEQLFDNANNFLESAKKEIIKSGERQHSISSDLYNLLIMEEFSSIVDYFDIGNFIRVCCDDKIYRLRLVSYKISFSDVNKIDVEFSDMTKTGEGLNDIQSLLSKASSMSTSYGYVSKQAEVGESAHEIVTDFRKLGLDASLYNVVNADTQDVVLDKHGILVRTYDDISDGYGKEQLKLINSSIVMTDDNWKTAKLAIGKQPYLLDGYKYEGYGVNADFCLSSIIIGGEIYSGNYSSTNKIGTHISLTNGDFSFAGEKLVYDQKNDKLTLTGEIHAKGGTFEGNIEAKGTITGGTIYGSEITAGNIYSKNYDKTTGKGTVINLDNGNFSIADGKIKFDDNHLNLNNTLIDFNTAFDSNDTTKTLQGQFSSAFKQAQDAQSSADAAQSSANTANSNITDMKDPNSTFQQGLKNSWEAYSQSSISTYDEKVAKYLTGGDKIAIGDDFILSPYLGGGYLNITSSNYRVVIDPNNLTGTSIIFGAYDTKNSKMIMGVDTSGNAKFSGEISGSSIKTSSIDIGGFKVDSSGNVTLPSGTKISWDDVNNHPTKVSEFEDDGTYITPTTITRDYVNTTYINALGITAKSVSSDWVYAGTVSCSNLSGGTITSQSISGGTISGALLEGCAGTFTEGITLVNNTHHTPYIDFNLRLDGTDYNGRIQYNDGELSPQGSFFGMTGDLRVAGKIYKNNYDELTSVSDVQTWVTDYCEANYVKKK